MSRRTRLRRTAKTRPGRRLAFLLRRRGEPVLPASPGGSSPPRPGPRRRRTRWTYLLLSKTPTCS
eukprot:5406958-Heterocapsa_arctica.AAC.1